MQTVDSREPSVADRTTAFDRTELYTAVGNIGRYLVELKYIDNARDYIAGRHQLQSAGPSPAYHYLDITLGTTYPFVERMGKHGTSWDEAEVESDLNDIFEAASRGVRGEMATLTDWIRPIAYPNASAYDSLAESFNGVHKFLEDKVETDFGTLSEHLGEWDGDIADNFKEKFYHTFPPARARQQSFVAALVGALAHSKAIVHWSQHSLMNIVVDTRDALVEQLLRRQQHTEGLSTKESLSIAAAGVSILGLTAMPVPLLGITLEIASGAMSVAAQMLPERKTETVKIEGQTADQLLVSFERALRELKDYVDKEYEELRIQLKDTKRTTDNQIDSFELLPKRPILVNHEEVEDLGREFYHND